MMKKKLLFLLALFVCIQTLQAEIRYIEIYSIDTNHSAVKIKNVSDFESLINEYGVKIGYIQKSGKIPQKLFIIIDSVYFEFELEGYSTLSDYKKGKQMKFEKASDYNKAMELGFDSSEIYYFYAKNSFSSAKDCLDALKNGFNNSTDYYNAKKLGYSTSADYRDYIFYTKSGFASKSEYNVAKQKGFSNQKEYKLALENGFSDYDTFDSARKLGIETNETYQKYLKTTSILEKIMKEKKFEKSYAIIYYYIQTLPKGEMAFSVLLASITNKFKEQDIQFKEALNLWYNNIQNIQYYTRYDLDNRPAVTSLFSERNLTYFLASADFSALGTYDAKTQIFKKK